MKGFVLGTITTLLTWGIFEHILGAKVTASWSYDYGRDPACSAARTANCIDHFEVEDITDSKRINVIRSVANPARAGGKVDNISVSFKYGPPFGQRTISVIAVGRDPHGNQISSNPYAARITVSIRPGIELSLLF